jgi:hypothetical protein
MYHRSISFLGISAIQTQMITRSGSLLVLGADDIFTAREEGL